MNTLELLRLIAATGCGIQMGGFLLLSLFHKPLFSTWPNNIGLCDLFKRFYRFNTVIAIISGLLAIFAGARSTGFLLAILGMSYILLLTHLIPAMIKLHNQSKKPPAFSAKRSPKESLILLNKLQIMAHFIQLTTIIYIVYRLST